MMSPRDGRLTSRPSRAGFTLIELMSVVAILSLIAAIAIPRMQAVVRQAKIARAIGDIRSLQSDILSYDIAGQNLPANLAVIGRAGLLDPWGHPYQYNPFPGGHGVPPGARRDRFLVPINSSFDLYSLGEDGKSVPPLTAQSSQDDVVRANDGGFIGLARKF